MSYSVFFTVNLFQCIKYLGTFYPRMLSVLLLLSVLPINGQSASDKMSILVTDKASVLPANESFAPTADKASVLSLLQL